MRKQKQNNNGIKDSTSNRLTSNKVPRSIQKLSMTKPSKQISSPTSTEAGSAISAETEAPIKARKKTRFSESLAIMLYYASVLCVEENEFVGLD